MFEIQKNTPLKWRLKIDHKYCWGEDKNLYNIQTGRKKKKCYNGGMIGYWLGKKFISLKAIREHIELIPKQKTPF